MLDEKTLKAYEQSHPTNGTFTQVLIADHRVLIRALALVFRLLWANMPMEWIKVYLPPEVIELAQKAQTESDHV